MFSAFNTSRPCGPNDQRTLWKVSVSYVTPSNPSSPPRQPIPFKIDLCMLHPHCPTSANNPEKKSSPIAKNPCHQNFNCHQSSSHIMCMHLLMNIAPQSIPLISLLMCHPPLATASSTVVDQRWNPLYLIIVIKDDSRINRNVFSWIFCYNKSMDIKCVGYCSQLLSAVWCHVPETLSSLQSASLHLQCRSSSPQIEGALPRLEV